MFRSTIIPLALAATATVLVAPAEATVGTAFTYQGDLKQNGEPFSGQVDLTFRLFDSEAGGFIIGTLAAPAYAVSDGLITIDLDFGVGVMNGRKPISGSCGGLNGGGCELCGGGGKCQREGDK